jgi:microtubule-associated protein-like 6
MFDVSALGCIDKAISGISWDPENKKILVGMWSSEIYEINDAEGYNLHSGPIVSGHYSGQVCDVAVNPHNPNQYCTVGSDKTVRVWDTAQKKVIKMVVLDTMCRCVAYSPDGAQIAVGFGGGGKQFKQKKDGGFVVLSEEDLTIAHEARDSKQTLTCVKFSLDGTSLAFGSMDRCIYAYNVGDFASKAKARGHKGGITHLDFGRVFGTNNAVFIQSNSDIGEILFWDIETGEQQTPRNQRDTEWETQTCVLAWPLKGAWGPYEDGAYLNCCCRSSSGELVATGDVFGRVRIYRYPAVGRNCNYVSYRGHGGALSSMRFSPDDKFLYTTGSDDCCVMQWLHEADGFEEDAGTLEANPEDAADLVDGKVLDKPSVWEMANVEDMAYTFAMEEQARDEDFTPVKPWQRTIVAPQQFEENVNEPDDTLVLEWIHGYRGADCRSNLYYGKGGCALYHVGNTVVKLDVKESAQSFYQDAKDEVTCLCMHPDRPICAVGEMGKIPYIHIFDYETMETIQTFTGYHRRAVSNLAFDPSGKYLLSIGMDEFHTMVVFDWENGVVKVRTRTCEAKTLGVDFTRDGKGAVQVGVDFINFWDFAGGNANFKTAILQGKGKLQPFFSVGWTGNYPVVGTTDGHLYRFLGRKLDVAVKAHASTVYTLHSTNTGIVSGGREGLVKVWSQSLECIISIDIQMLGSLSPAVKSVCWDNDLGKILVGTAGNEIWEVASSDGQNMHLDGPLEQGHFADELWGLSISPSNPHYATVGDDKTLRIWDLFEHKLVKMSALEMMSRACCYSPDGTMIAVGFGSPVKKSTKQFDGKWMIMNEADFSIIYEARDSQKWITEMKWSPGGEKLCVGSWDNKIYLYDVDLGDRLKIQVTMTSVITQHNSYITHMDFSANNTYLQSNCGAYELCYFEADTGMYIPAASRLKDTRWETQQCALGWAVQGCWPAQNDGTEITAVDCNLVNEFGNVVVASGDNFGRLQLFRYPCLSSFSLSKKFRGHSGHIVKVRWAGGDSHLITVGAKDKGVFIWRHEADDQAVMDNQTAMDTIDDSDVELEVADVPGDVPGEAAEGAEGGDVGMDKPWIAAMVEPSEPPAINPDLPDSKLELVYAHGVETQTLRNAVLYNAKSEIVYPNAGLCVVYNKEDHEQKFFKGHEGNSVSALAVSNNGRFSASGESSRRPRVRVWDACTCAEIACMREFQRSGIVSLAFSDNCKRLVSVASDADRSIVVWVSLSGEWKDAQMQCNAKGASERVFFSNFCAPDSEFQMVSGGLSHIKFWSLEGANMTSSKGLFGTTGKVQPMLCGAPCGTKFITGTVSGHLYVWVGRKLEKIVRAHERCINAICSNAGGLVTGGKDGFVKVWATNLEHLKSYDLNEASVLPLDVGVRSVYAALDVTGKFITKILVGTKSSEIYEIAMKSGSMIQLHEGHYEGEVWGLAMHPTDKDVFCTVGDDKTVRIWSISLNRMLRKLKTDTVMRSVAWSNDGKFLLIGCGGSSGGKRGKKDGAFLVIEVSSLDVKFEGRDSRHWIRDVKYSPDGTSFAVASMDQKIYLYETKNFVLRGKAEKHNASILFFDFSTDSQMIQSDSADHEHLNHNSNDGAHFGLPSQLKNVDWFTYTCLYGWPCQGIWPTKKEVDAPLPVSCHRSGDRRMLAVGQSKGGVALYNYPAVSKTSQKRTEQGHAGEVANCRFSIDDETLVTVGKHDRGILVWKVRNAAVREAGEGKAEKEGGKAEEKKE